ncbi:MAG TPA: bifunctional UDP-sugar hydrolase/5'-nucleotidase [Bacillota bacterium]|nr:bifunctional UDP-sugar hydrolase/5'-nucleotidase [Bacillota bacterium]
MEEKIYIYYTNDLHSNFQQWPRVARFLKDKKRTREAYGDAFFLMDIGDHMDRVHPISEAFKGKANVALLNKLEYDFVTIGNNEGITLSHEELFQLYDEASFEVICANLHSLRGENPAWLHPIGIKETKSGIRIGVIGLTAPFNDYYELLDWHVSPIYSTLDRHIHNLKNSSDIVVLMSHLGLSEDEEIARRYPEIDVIIGGHTHHLLRTGEEIQQTIITAAGKHCFHVGEVILTWSHSEKKLVKKEAYATDITNYEKDMDTKETLREMEKKADGLLEETVAELEKPLEKDWFRDTLLMQELTHTLRKWTKADCAMLNAGLLLDSLPAGKVTYKDVHRVCPHPINPVIVELTGNELVEVIRVSLTKEFMEFPLKGFGFRGEMLGKMMFSGINVETGRHRNGEPYVKNVIQENGELINGNKRYFVATADTFTFGRMLPEVAKSEVKQYFLPEFIRDLLADTLKHKFSKQL